MYDIVIGRREADKEKYGTQGSVFIGKHYVKMGQTVSLSNNVYLDVAKSHVVFVCGKRGCLTEDTKIFTNHGYKEIKEFNPSINKVYSYNGNDFEWETAELLKYPIDNEELIRIDNYDGQSLVATEEHPLLTLDNGNKIWKDAKHLKVGDILVSTSVPQINLFENKITGISKINGAKEVYDLHLPKNHSFIANGVISHNSGKSYSMSVIAEGIYDLPDEIRQNLAVVMLDTMGIYWTMKYPNTKEKDLLEEWGLESKGINVQIFTPIGFYKEYKDKGIPTDFPFSIKISELSAEDWCMIFNVSMTDPIGILIERIINNLKEENSDYDMNDIIKSARSDDRSEQGIKDAVENRFLVAEKWGLFSNQGTLIEDLVIPGQIAVLDVSAYTTTSGAENLRALVIGLVAQKLFSQRMAARKAEEQASISEEIHLFEEEKEGKKEPIVWLIVDEAHEFLPNKGKTPATLPLITILREGRQPGISLVLASQQPGKIHTDVFTQADVVIAHRITANIDVMALGNIMQSYMREGLDKQLNLLPTEEGAAIIFDDINEKLYPIRVRPKYSWHGGGAPTALPREKKVFEF